MRTAHARVVLWFSVFLVLGLLGAHDSAKAAPLTAQTLSATSNRPIFPSSALVGPGVEFTYPGTDSFGQTVTFDFNEDGLLTITHVFFADFSYGPSFDVTFSDVNGTIQDIIGVSLIGVSGVSGFDSSDLTTTADSVSLRIGSSTWEGPTSSATLQLSFAATQVSEPPMLAILAFGLAGLAYAKRRRTKREH
jgi:hypothetical protein